MSLDQPADFVKRQTSSTDAFLGGRLTVSQPVRGFRAGLDSVLLGASVRAGAKTLLDLGSGPGVAALVALAHHGALHATLIDSDPVALALAGENVAANGFSGRATTSLADVAAPGATRAAAGIPADHFDAVIANPPFFAEGAGTAATARGTAARHMAPDELELWVRAAATHAAAGGEVIFVHTPQGLPVLLPEIAQRFGAIAVLPLSPRPGEAANRILVRAIKGSRAPLTLLAARALHGADGRAFTPEFEAIFRGEAVLVW
jgi:tRNA1(Val) A37 N6-methylase TrmN6